MQSKAFVSLRAADLKTLGEHVLSQAPHQPSEKNTLPLKHQTSAIDNETSPDMDEREECIQVMMKAGKTREFAEKYYDSMA